MIDRLLFSVIGLLLLSVTGVGVTAAIEHPDEAAAIVPTAIEVTEDAIVDAADSLVHTAASVVQPLSATPDDAQDSEQGVQAAEETKVESGAGVLLSAREDEEVEDCDPDEDDAEGDDEDEDECSRVAPPSSPPPAPVAATQGSSPPQPAPAPSGKTFTMADVAAHASAGSCYSAINGSVYDLTSFISMHPGGSAAIKSLCGVDGSAAFNAQHGGAGTPAQELASLKIGILAK